MLLGILDILDPDLFLQPYDQQQCTGPQVQLVAAGVDGHLPAALPVALGAAPVKLEALNELIHLDHIYTKSVAEVHNLDDDDDSSSSSDHIEGDIHAEVKTEDDAAVATCLAAASPVCVKVEQEEAAIVPDTACHQTDDFLSSVAEDEVYLEKDSYLADTYSDSGYERSPSPLCSESSWDDAFANELFPQLFSA